MPDPVEVERLECAECGWLSELGASGWPALWTDDGLAAGVFCPEALSRE